MRHARHEAEHAEHAGRDDQRLRLAEELGQQLLAGALALADPRDT